MSKPVHLCIPTLKRYDLLRRLLLSLKASTLPPTSVLIIDNGRSYTQLMDAISGTLPGDVIDVRWPGEPCGLAECWNYAAKVLPEDRVIVNDDCTFAPDSLAQMVAAPGAFVSALTGSNAFSCFLWRDACIDNVGYFDEAISPGYAYFEDNDYDERMVAAGVAMIAVECGVAHDPSQTLAVYTDDEVIEHHARFTRARANFVRKWGGTPQELRARRKGEVPLG